jgi:hypothetical protein
MFKLPIRTWVCNAAAVFSGPHGAVTQQAQESGCSRETVYEHARKVEQRLADSPVEPAALAELRAENQRLRRMIADLQGDSERAIRFGKAERQRFATVAFAMGVSLRQVEALLGLILSDAPGKAPDHSTIGHWIGQQAERAGHVLEVLDPHCAPFVSTLCLDEIFFGGDRPWWASSRRA